MIIKNIIKSEKEPATNCLWLKDNSLYHFNNGEWTPVDINSVLGIEKLQQDVDNINKDISVINKNYIGVWNELQTIKETLTYIQSGELPALLTELGYNEEDINAYIDTVLEFNEYISIDDIRRSVQIWKDRDKILHNILIKNDSYSENPIGSALNMVVIPKWDEEKDSNGLHHEYTSDLGTTSIDLNIEQFLGLFPNPIYCPYIFSSKSNVRKLKILAKYVDTVKVCDLTEELYFQNLCSINNLTFESTGYIFPICNITPVNFRHVGNTKFGSGSNCFYFDNSFKTEDLHSFNKFDLSRCYNAKEIFSAREFYKDVSLIGEFDITKIPHIAHDVQFMYGDLDTSIVTYKMFSNRKLKDSIVYMNSACLNVFSNACLDGGEVYIDASTQQFGDSSLNLLSSNEFEYVFGNAETDSNISRYDSDGTHVYLKDLEADTLYFRRVFPNNKKNRIPILTIHCPNANKIHGHFRGSEYIDNIGKATWIRDITNGTTEVDIRNCIDPAYFSNIRAEEMFNSWEAQSNPCILMLTTGQYQNLSETLVASIAENNYTIIVED